MTRWPIILLLSLTVAVIFIPMVVTAMRDSRNRTILNVGYLTAITGELKDKQGLAISGALTLALDEINEDSQLLPNVKLALRWNDTKGDTVLATKAITEMICDGISVIFGPEGHCYVEAIVSQSRNIPMISYKCSENRASNIRTFARTEPPDTQVIKSVISLLRYYGWKKFSILHDEVWTTVADQLKQEAVKFNMTINHKESFIDNMAKCCELMLACCRNGFWYQIVQNTMNRTRIYVFLGTANALVEFMVSMDTANLFAKGEYMVIFVDMMTYTPKEAEKYLRKPDQVEHMTSCDETESFSQRARSLLVVASTPPTDSYENFTTKVREYNSLKPFNFFLPSLFHSNNYIKFVSIYAAYLYDAVRLYAWALDKLIREKSQSEKRLTDEEVLEVASDGQKIIETIINYRTYKSVTGATINIDNNGDSEGNFSVLAFKPYKYLFRDNLSCNYHMVPVAHFQQGRDIPEYKLINGSIRVDWPSGGDRPFDEPMCGFANELCKKDDRHITSVLVATILGLLLFCAGVVAMSIYRKWKIELEIEGLLWKIDIAEIKGYYGNDIVSSPSKLSLVSAQSYGSRCSNQVFTVTARLRGAVVRIKELKFIKKRDMSRDLMKEMRLLRELRHDNVNSFIGACIEPTRILLVTDYCAKGSLYDIIENDDIKLDDLFIASLVHDLIKGMIYIHDSSLGYHGNLKSSNCVVTSRWMLQVTDFGLHDLRQCAESESIGEHQHYRNQFWKAPELLRNPHVYGSQKGDVYAFAIIMYEIFSRKGPFGQTLYEPKEIVDLVKNRPISGCIPFRPELDCIIDGELCPDYVLNCITDCWHEDPEIRPDFHTIRNRLKKMRGGKTKNIMDQMMEMMEKYANNLEDIVNERTRLLCEEKRKTEDLLHRMLPQSVAAKLTMGMGVEPVSYDKVTIYFSDIVGFTALSAESTPLQVVNFLNDLYTVFDRIIRGYDVYKVETIGDAYMVVSGLPILNDDRHAGEIASMALELLQAVKQHRIAHRPNEILKLRIGIHTGPVVAGVVGLTMPRYCLFGDTVNTASRMESNGEALKIHISDKCKEALDKLDGYITEERGKVYMKGKGEVTTYWLIAATEKAIQKKPVDMNNMPPPLFCRPCKSPKFNSDSRQPSIGGMYYTGTGSRRQSVAPRAEMESTYSLQDSIQLMQNDSTSCSSGNFCELRKVTAATLISTTTSATTTAIAPATIATKTTPSKMENIDHNATAAMQLFHLPTTVVASNFLPDCIDCGRIENCLLPIGSASTLNQALPECTLDYPETNCDSSHAIMKDFVDTLYNNTKCYGAIKPLAMVRPHRHISPPALNGDDDNNNDNDSDNDSDNDNVNVNDDDVDDINNDVNDDDVLYDSNENSSHSNNRSNNNIHISKNFRLPNIRTSRSLDLIPTQWRKRYINWNVLKSVPILSIYKRNKSRSIDAVRRISFISDQLSVSNPTSSFTAATDLIPTNEANSRIQIRNYNRNNHHHHNNQNSYYYQTQVQPEQPHYYLQHRHYHHPFSQSQREQQQQQFLFAANDQSLHDIHAFNEDNEDKRLNKSYQHQIRNRKQLIPRNIEHLSTTSTATAAANNQSVPIVKEKICSNSSTPSAWDDQPCIENNDCLNTDRRITSSLLLPYSHFNNNCNGGIIYENADAETPLLIGTSPAVDQQSTNSRQKRSKALLLKRSKRKRWHSLEDIDHRHHHHHHLLEGHNHENDEGISYAIDMEINNDMFAKDYNLLKSTKKISTIKLSGRGVSGVSATLSSSLTAESEAVIAASASVSSAPPSPSSVAITADSQNHNQHQHPSSNSILDRLVNIFHGNGKRNTEASSLRRVGILPNSVRGVTAFSEINETKGRDRESMV